MRRFPVRMAVLLTLTLTAGLAACEDDIIAPPGPEDVEFAPELGVDLDAMTKLESGVYIQTLEPGTGSPVGQEGTVIVDYQLWLPNGQQIIEESEGANQSFDLDQVIAGFALGLESAREGETRLLVIPPALGYGSAGVPDAGIPGNAVLVFRVHVDQVNPPG